MSIHDALRQIDPDTGKRFALEYFEVSEGFPGTGVYTGSHFESIGGVSTPDYEVTAVDLLAVQNLSVKVPARAAIGILEAHASQITELLKKIDPELRLESLESEDKFQEVLGEGSPALDLWRLLRQTGPGLKRWGVGPTIASKIMARKRPHLIPIEDKIVNRAIRLGKNNSWRMWWEELRADGCLLDRATEVKQHLEQSTEAKIRLKGAELSTLRALDIVLWMSGRPKDPAKRAKKM